MMEEADLPERTCILTRLERAPEDMIRFVLSPDDEVVPDLKRKLPGRGAWVTADQKSVAEAAKRRLFAKAFKAEVKPLDHLASRVETLLEQDALGSLAMANKAGVVTTGFVKVEAAFGAGKVAVLLSAADAAEDGLRKMRQVMKRHLGEAQSVPTISRFSIAQMSLCLGRENVIHGALSGASVTDRFVEKCRRLERYRVGITNEPGLDLAGNAGPRPSFI
jgi:uncharacterized protein